LVIHTANGEKGVAKGRKVEGILESKSGVGGRRGPAEVASLRGKGVIPCIAKLDHDRLDGAEIFKGRELWRHVARAARVKDLER
jgi:hypothetical protein